MNEIKDRFDHLIFPDSINGKYSGIQIKWHASLAGIEIFDFYSPDNKMVNIGDDADYLPLFMTITETLVDFPLIESEPMLVACDAKGQRLFAKTFSQTEKETYKYAYIALGAAAKELPENEINQTFNFFAEISRVCPKNDKFESEAKKVARSLKDTNLSNWNRITNEKLDFMKTDLYVYHLLKLYSWGFRIIEKNGELSPDVNLVRPKPGKPRGASRH